tara:strand:- start:44 stop:433 length:390 start_codon:yes stop_codon:yes gene_type:complete
MESKITSIILKSFKKIISNNKKYKKAINEFSKATSVNILENKNFFTSKKNISGVVKKTLSSQEMPEFLKAIKVFKDPKFKKKMKKNNQHIDSEELIILTFASLLVKYKSNIQRAGKRNIVVKGTRKLKN